ncbi:hypothetical protein EZS27_036851, partial [termite gut metagenome]
MKKTLLLATWCVLLLSCNTQPKHYAPVNPNATPEAKALLAMLYRSVDEGKIISAQHHNESLIAHPERYEQDRDRILQATGKVPMIWGGDMGWDRETVVNKAVEEYEKGH